MKIAFSTSKIKIKRNPDEDEFVRDILIQQASSRWQIGPQSNWAGWPGLAGSGSHWYKLPSSTSEFDKERIFQN